MPSPFSTFQVRGQADGLLAVVRGESSEAVRGQRAVPRHRVPRPRLQVHLPADHDGGVLRLPRGVERLHRLPLYLDRQRKARRGTPHAPEVGEAIFVGIGGKLEFK